MIKPDFAGGFAGLKNRLKPAQHKAFQDASMLHVADVLARPVQEYQKPKTKDYLTSSPEVLSSAPLTLRRILAVLASTSSFTRSA